MSGWGFGWWVSDKDYYYYYYYYYYSFVLSHQRHTGLYEPPSTINWPHWVQLLLDGDRTSISKDTCHFPERGIETLHPSMKLTFQHTRMIVYTTMEINNPVTIQSSVTMPNEKFSRVSLQVPCVHPSVTLAPLQGMYESDLTLPHVP